ncbi:MAG: glutamate-5-semialdehyde dehydrogenase [Clostridiales bacterium]|nr:glutamate-5-semialdehyde dehydrogenase [Clostridiales bacterium]
MTLNEIGAAAQKASRFLVKLGQKEKNEAITAAANALLEHKDILTAANEIDVKNARDKGMKESLVDRLMLTDARINSMAKGLLEIAALNDPVGEIVESTIRPNGLEVCKKRVPLGVIGIIYESRPNVTADAFGLCFKAGNAVILKGGSDAINSNTAIVSVLRTALCDYAKTGGIDGALLADCILLIEDTSRETAREFMRQNRYVDVLIPRGGAGLIRTVVENSTIPVIETGTGNCHVYVDESADIDMAVKIIENAKTQRTGVCNACESLVIHKNILNEAFPKICEVLKSHGVEIRADEAARSVVGGLKAACEEDFGTEYLDLIISVKTVASLDEAIEHINIYNTKHSETIVTKDYANARRFLNEIDAAAVYVNASTRFTDGFEFGFGAEIGISTQKLHARGPMGLKELTTTKYVVYGDGQIRQ